MSEPVTLLDGKVIANQADAGFRSGLDAVLLGASIDIKPEHVGIEFGCGSGAAMLVAAHHNKVSRFQGFDKMPALVGFAEDNIAANGWSDRVVAFQADVGNPGHLGMAHQVFFNPPFYDDPKKMVPPKFQKHAAYMSGDAPLEVWIRLANKVLTPKGRMTLIHRADRLGDILGISKKWFGDVVIKPISPYADRPAKRILVSAKKGTFGDMKILPPLVLHDGSDRKYTEEAESILRGSDRIELR
ncbi:methyltransferase [Hyphobacterium sp. HN65]|uniref:Methyltransferase n=1 Tax=Hyphobacterium lacteum TaxID=3116575 RepID=A0ABU7LMW1_9PROT|nr:methyltransferase [Hyphobacterium sp. HN65]MEE2525266.1 methyltransferase [Hyphobacterium sp. HN65]